MKPSWELFSRLVTEAKRELVICAPWISSAGLQRLQHLLLDENTGRSLTQVQLWARIADINTDSPGILELALRLAAVGVSTVVRDSPVLHAKIYLADRSLALVTSANLSEGGFSSNIEAAVVISEPQGIGQVLRLLEEIQAATTQVSLSDLEEFIIKQRPLIEAQAPPAPPPAIVPVWRLPVASVSPGSALSRSLDLLELIESLKASLQAAQDDIQHVDLNDWVGKKARVCVCPCYMIKGPSPELSRLMSPYFFGELELDQRLMPERFFKMDGIVERVLEQERAVFKKKRARKANIELTRFPDPGSNTILHYSGRDSYFLLSIQAEE
jgi:hypothetical protein